METKKWSNGKTKMWVVGPQNDELRLGQCGRTAESRWREKRTGQALGHRILDHFNEMNEKNKEQYK